MSEWIKHVKRYSKTHGVSYGEALSLARPSYKSQSVGAGKSHRKGAGKQHRKGKGKHVQYGDGFPEWVQDNATKAVNSIYDGFTKKGEKMSFEQALKGRLNDDPVKYAINSAVKHDVLGDLKKLFKL
jgi:hypothetical protein